MCERLIACLQARAAVPRLKLEQPYRDLRGFEFGLGSGFEG